MRFELIRITNSHVFFAHTEQRTRIDSLNLSTWFVDDFLRQRTVKTSSEHYIYGVVIHATVARATYQQASRFFDMRIRGRSAADPVLIPRLCKPLWRWQVQVQVQVQVQWKWRVRLRLRLRLRVRLIISVERVPGIQQGSRCATLRLETQLFSPLFAPTLDRGRRTIHDF